ncbi:MAG: Asp-tRNA(Asn)/Glu-tRNA(Gln) amidotransferase subunit GatC [Gemmatimonadales bacterium]|nr:aspartyl/glutamyl-tRNA amidotransferase subunit C [Gemmatimonadales bacterium]MDX2058654.1 Asp-tRNA(Asn)/Glu-tRNA(Gln) amidotransferase subunit GatC [Gemmatimonadales bacterium]
MTISGDDLRRIARLAELDVTPAEIDRLAAEVDEIVGYVGQLADLTDRADEGFLPGPARAALRPDRVDPTPLERPPADIAPEFQEGFFLVPRLPAMEDG